MTNVLGLERNWCKDAADVLGDEAARVAGAPFVVALIIEDVTVKLIGSALGDGVYDASGRTSEASASGAADRSGPGWSIAIVLAKGSSASPVSPCSR